jgi:predicted esterase
LVRSLLVYQDLPPDAGEPAATVIALHGHGGTVDQLVPLCRQLQVPVHIVAPQAARPVNAADRTYSPDAPGGYRWHFGDRDAEPEPATFGESLWSVEQFIYDVADRVGPRQPLVMLGVDQGATLALTLAAVVPDYIAGVAAVDGFLPVIRGWSPPYVGVTEPPVLLLNDLEGGVSLRSLQRTIDELAKRHGRVQAQSIAGLAGDLSLAAQPISEWLRTSISPAPRNVEVDTAVS